MMDGFVRSLIKQQFQNFQRVRLVSSIGNGTNDIFVDFQGSTSQPTIIIAAAQNQPPGPSVNANVGMFLCSSNQRVNQPTFNADGTISQSMLGTEIGQDGSTLTNWGFIFQNFYGLPLIIPVNGFIRFSSLMTVGVPPNSGAIFQIDISYFNIDLCDCELDTVTG